MLQQVSKAQFKPKALHYLRQVEQTQQPLVITHHAKPVVKVVPVKQNDQDDVLKELKGTVLKYEDPFEPVGLEDWEALK